MEGCIYLFGNRRSAKLAFNAVFCAFAVIGCTTQLDAVLDFSDAMIFAMALANVLGLYLLAPVVKHDLDAYWQRVRGSERPMVKHPG